MNWNLRPLVLTTLCTLFTAISSMATTPPTVSATRPLQFTSGGHIVGFTSKDVVIATGSHALRIEFVGAQSVEPIASGTAAPDGKATPLTRVTYPGIWSGITLAFDAPSGLMRSTYTVAPGADPAQIRLRYNTPIAVEPGGGLRIAFATGTMSESAPVAWQEKDGHRVPVSVSFRTGSEREVGFALGSYDKIRPLTIDPTLTWSTFLGVTASGSGAAIAIDADGSIFVTGKNSATWGAPIRIYTRSNDAFVAKFDANGTLIWNTFLGGNSLDCGFGIAVDASGNLFVTGESHATWGTPIQAYVGSSDTFIAKLDGNGALLWNTFLGVAESDTGESIVVDRNGNVYVAGLSFSTWGTPIGAFAGSADAFVAKLDGNGVLLWNTFLGGVNNDFGYGIAVDASDNVFVTGESDATWGTPIQAYTGSYDAFVAKLDDNGELAWNTFFGNGACGISIATDTSGNVLVTGQIASNSSNLSNPIRPSKRPFAGYTDAFVAKFDTNGALMWHTFLGGNGGALAGNDFGSGIAVDGNGSINVTGTSFSTWGDPSVAFAVNNGNAFVAKLDSNGTLMGNTFLGGISVDYGLGIADDVNGDAYVTGYSASTWGDPIRAFSGSFTTFLAKPGDITNAPPVSYNQVLSILEDTAATITSAATDTDGANGNTVTCSVIISPAHGTLSASLGQMIYRPAANYNGPDSFTFKATDDIADSNVATATITIMPVNDPPVAIWQNLTFSEGTILRITLGATDIDGDLLAYSVVAETAHGTLSGTAPDLTYQPAAHFVGLDSFIFKVNDGSLDSNTATVSITVVADNARPTGSILINNGATSTGSTVVTLNLTATDTGGSGVASMHFRNSTVNPYSAWEPYRTTKSWTLMSGLGTKKVYAQFMDNAGNLSDANPSAAGTQGYMDAIELVDKTVPTGSIKINNGAASTGSTTVTLNLSASDSGGSGVGSMRFRNNTTDPYSAWEPYQTTKTWLLTGGAGTKKVYVQFKDTAGNVSDANAATAGAQGYMDSIVCDPIVTTNCEGCHGSSPYPGTDGGSGDDAPSVMANYNVNGHGTKVFDPDGAGPQVARAVECKDCHELASPSPGTHLNGIFETYSFPGSTFGGPNTNTSHLVSAYFGTVSAEKDWQVNFDNNCFKNVFCHKDPPARGHHHESFHNDGVVRFGNHSTVADPKRDRSPLAYWTPWTIQDISTDAPPGSFHYAPCVACHDPHGVSYAGYTNCPDTPDGNHHMVRKNNCDVDYFCSSNCHRL